MKSDDPRSRAPESADRDSHTSRGLDRRSLLGLGAAAVGGALVAGRARASRAVTRDARGIPVRSFGSTGLELPVLGMGGSAMVNFWAESYNVRLGSPEERAEMVRHAYDAGIRYFDTARAYQESESIMGLGLQGVRDEVYVATKVHDPNSANTRKSVETSLAELRTDRLDCVQIHSPVIEAVGYDGAMRVREELEKLRGEGLVRHVGLTTHVAFEDVLRMIETGSFDQVLLAYGYFRKGMTTLLSNRKIELRDLCLARAHERGMAIVAMKVLGANIMSHAAPKVVPEISAEEQDRVARAAIRWTLADERVSVLNIGVSMKSDVDRNVGTLQGRLELDEDDRVALAEFSRAAYESPLVKAMEVS